VHTRLVVAETWQAHRQTRVAARRSFRCDSCGVALPRDGHAFCYRGVRESGTRGANQGCSKGYIKCLSVTHCQSSVWLLGCSSPLQRGTRGLEGPGRDPRPGAGGAAGTRARVFLCERLKASPERARRGRIVARAQRASRKLDALDLPKEARSEVDRELVRLLRSPRESTEAPIRSYVQWIVEPPWNRRTADVLDLPRAERVLDEDHCGLRDVKDRVLEFLSIRALNARRLSRRSPPQMSTYTPVPWRADPRLSWGRPVGKTFDRTLRSSRSGSSLTDVPVEASRLALPGDVCCGA
jgi:hypothetical protein